jgi:uncharacterized membrane protein YhaH (DUF805 family)
MYTGAAWKHVTFRKIGKGGMPNWVGELLRFWSRLDVPVSRRSYCINGFGLAALKYFGDVALVGLTTGQFWKPTDYLHTTHSLFFTTLPGAPEWLIPALAIWTLPFLWIGITLTLRRALDAGLSPWWTMFFFVPFANYVLMAALCLIPGSSRKFESAGIAKPGGKRMSSAIIGIAAGVCFALVVIVAAVLLKGEYGYSLFFGAPFATGALTAFLFNRRYPASVGETLQVTIMMLLSIAGVLLLFAFEGVVCIAMAVPIGLVVGLLGAIAGRAMARWGQSALPPALSAMLLLPIFAALEPPNLTGRTLREVQSSVVINAPPERVWPHVIAFEPIPDPTDIVFRLGIAYPRYAHIEGTGANAVRYCVFSTGPFVEPITDWEPGKQLAFDVTSSPEPLRELSLYANLSPPHLHGYLRSRRGEFRLVALSGGRTRREGSTWYEIEMAPEAYWQIWSNFLIHRIHDRVLEHIKSEVETRSSVSDDSEIR